MNRKSIFTFFKEVTPAIVGPYIVWLGLSPAAAIMLALFMPEFSEPEKILLAMSFPFVFPISLSQITFIDYEDEIPLNNLRVMELFFLPIIAVGLQTLILEIPFLFGFVMVVFSGLCSRLIAHIAASAKSLIFSKNGWWFERISVTALYLLMTIPVFVFGQKVLSQYIEKYESNIGYLSLMIAILILTIFDGARIMYGAFKDDFEVEKKM